MVPEGAENAAVGELEQEGVIDISYTSCDCSQVFPARTLIHRLCYSDNIIATGEGRISSEEAAISKLNRPRICAGAEYNRISNGTRLDVGISRHMRDLTSCCE